MTRARPCILPLAALLIAACSSAGPSELDRNPAPAILEHYGDATGVLTAPGSVAPGVEFEVIVTSFGPGCYQAGPVEVEQTASTVEIRVYDLVPVLSARMACPDNLIRIEHRVALRRTEPGDVTLRVHGRQAPGDAAVTIAHTLTVQ